MTRTTATSSQPSAAPNLEDDRRERRELLAPALALAGLFVVLHVLPFVNRPALIGGDEVHFALMASSLAADGDVSLENNYRAVERGSAQAGAHQRGVALDRHEREVGGRRVFAHPLGLPALGAVVLRAVAFVAPGLPPDVPLILLTLLVTGSAAWVGLILLRETSGNADLALLTAASLYFCTPLWFYSRTFFTEPYLWSLGVMAAWGLWRRRWWLAGMPLGLAILVKEPAAIAVTILIVSVAATAGLRSAAKVATGPGVALAVFVAKNLAIYGDPFVTYQTFGLGDPASGAAGLLMDSRHGLLPFAPVLGLAVVLAAVPGLPRLSSAAARRTGLALFVAYFALVAAWTDWRGGSCFGPRLLIPALPALAPLLLDVWRLAQRDRIVWYGACLLATLGFCIQAAAATAPFAAFWSIDVGQLLTGRPAAVFTAAILATIFLALSRRRLRATI